MVKRAVNIARATRSMALLLVLQVHLLIVMLATSIEMDISRQQFAPRIAQLLAVYAHARMRLSPIVRASIHRHWRQLYCCFTTAKLAARLRPAASLACCASSARPTVLTRSLRRQTMESATRLDRAVSNAPTRQTALCRPLSKMRQTAHTSLSISCLASIAPRPS